jgi:hypothetical protein
MFWGEDVPPAVGPDLARWVGWWREVVTHWRHIAELLRSGLAGAGRAVGG